ncbi:MAG: efflux RND transporter periplasmic adaptor subunit [Chlorobi bacterium]|nr:efflux RND transporter periplasmic adaptor subunit [Chlorobiota bacterium]
MQRIQYILIITVLILNVYSCRNSENKENNTTEVSTNNNYIILTKAQFEQSNMKLASIVNSPFPEIVQATGMIDVPPANRAVVSATMGGYIKTNPLLVGDKITKGQVLVTISNPEFVTLQQEYMEIKEQLSYLKAEFKRQETLYKENITSQKNFLKAESNYKSARAKYNGLKKQLQLLNISVSSTEKGIFTSFATIYAPISGSISKVNVSKGAYVSPATEIMEIINSDHIHLELSVFEKDIMKLKKGQKIEFKIPEASTQIFDAQVHLIGTSIDDNRTVKVHGHLTGNSHEQFLIGMFIDAQIITNNHYAMALPSEAIVTIDDKSYVLLLQSENGNEYQFNSIEIKTGVTYSGYTEIIDTNKFKIDDIFLTRGAFNLLQE